MILLNLRVMIGGREGKERTPRAGRKERAPQKKGKGNEIYRKGKNLKTREINALWQGKFKAGKLYLNEKGRKRNVKLPREISGLAEKKERKNNLQKTEKQAQQKKNLALTKRLGTEGGENRHEIRNKKKEKKNRRGKIQER